MIIPSLENSTAERDMKLDVSATVANRSNILMSCSHLSYLRYPCFWTLSDLHPVVFSEKFSVLFFYGHHVCGIGRIEEVAEAEGAAAGPGCFLSYSS